MSYVIITDSTCDLPNDFVLANDIKVIPMHFQVEGREYINYLDEREMGSHDFYDKMRAGAVSKTSQLTIPDIKEAYKKELDRGLDILGIVFSSALSGTFNTVRLTVEELKEEYPERSIMIIDSKCASLGEGLFVYYANKFKSEGASLLECHQKLEDLKLHLAHWFTVDDIDTLRRGGRLSNAQAFVAKLAKIKPVLHVSDEGKLVAVYKKIGRRQALLQLVTEMKKTIDTSFKQTIMIAHGDDLEDALYVGNKVNELVDCEKIIYNNIGPVIGSHSGPGTIALFFIASKR